MERRDFFALAGGVSLALAGCTTARDGAAGGPAATDAEMSTLVKKLRGTEFDRTAVSLAASLASDWEDHGICWKWSTVIRPPWRDEDTINWVASEKVFGEDFKSLPLSGMLERISQRNIRDIGMRVGRDGSLQIAM